MTILVIEASVDPTDTRRRLQQLAASGSQGRIVAVDRDGATDVLAALERLDDRAAVAFLPSGAVYAKPLATMRLRRSVMAWPINKTLPEHSCSEPDSDIQGWIMSADLAREILPAHTPSQWRLDKLGPHLEKKPGVHWLSSPNEAPLRYPPSSSAAPKLTRAARVIAIVPHFACEPWLGAAITSLTQQTRPLDAIAVVDDGSVTPPKDICRQFPEVTLLRSGENVGSYRLLQQVIEETDYDAIFFQDADDWSCVDRLELSLAELERTGAEWVGTQEIRLAESGLYQPASYPLDVNRASENGPQHPLLNPTSMVSRHLVQRLGGIATGLRFSGDTELLYRAVFDARIVNLPDFSFVHRKRANSMVTSPETGMQSRKRQDLLKLLHERADHNLAQQRAGKPLDLAPLSKAPPVKLTHVCGPKLRPAAP
jgi:hypothetical protein